MENRPIRMLVPEALKSQVTRRAALAAALGTSALGVLAACSTGSSSSSGAVEKTINLYTWGQYDDPDVLSEWGSVTLGSYDSNEELISKLTAANGTSGYDIVVPTLQYIPKMTEAGLLQEIDHSLLSNYDNLDPNYLNSEFDPDNTYSIPKAWGTCGYAYDTTVITRELTSWADFWDALQNEAAGKTSLIADMNEIAGAYFLSQGLPITTTDESALSDYESFITSVASNIQAFESYVSTTIAQSGRALLQGWNGDVRRGMLDNEDQSRYKWVLPSDGSTLFQDNWCIPVGAPNPEGAHEFINYVLDPDISFRELEYIGYPTGILDPDERSTSEGLDDMIFFTQDQVDKMQRLAITDANDRLLEIFNALQAAAG